MSKSTKIYKAKSEKVIFEQIDDEIVIVNLENGHFYNLSSSGVVLWQMVQAGCTFKKMMGQLDALFNTDKSVMENDLELFLRSLIKEKLVVKLDEGETGDYVLKSGEYLEYEAPTIEVYTDIEELLLLDPIHDIDETGWPSKKIEG
jgi:hypothetical protein